MPDDVVARGDAFWNGECVRVVLGNELLCAPVARLAGCEKGFGVNLKPCELSLVDTSTRAVAVGHVGDHWAEMCVGPRRPVRGDLLAGLHRDRRLSGCTGLVADDVRVLAGRMVSKSCSGAARVGSYNASGATKPMSRSVIVQPATTGVGVMYWYLVGS